MIDLSIFYGLLLFSLSSFGLYYWNVDVFFILNSIQITFKSYNVTFLYAFDFHLISMYCFILFQNTNIMLRNGRKNVRKKNTHNRRNRNEWLVVSDEDDVSASDCWETSCTSEEDSDVADLSDYVSSTRRRPVRKVRKPKTKRNASKKKIVSICLL